MFGSRRRAGRGSLGMQRSRVRGSRVAGFARLADVNERRLPGGNTGGAHLVDGTVRRARGRWTPAVHALLDHLQAQGFAGAPRALGVDELGREVLSFMPGITVGDSKPWPAWVRSEAALLDVGSWLRSYHEIATTFVPPADACWRTSRRAWRPGDVIGHNDAAPYNAVWRPAPWDEDDPRSRGLRGRLVGFIDWDFAAPCSPLWDLAFTAFSWVPLHARDVAIGDGFSQFDERPARLRLLLDAYRYTGTVDDLLDVIVSRVEDHSRGVQEFAAAGDPFFARLIDHGVIEALDRALGQLEQDRDLLIDEA